MHSSMHTPYPFIYRVSLSLFPCLSFPPLPAVHTHRFLAEKAHWRGAFEVLAVSAKVRALSIHTWHRFVLVTHEQVMVRSSREENDHGSPLQPVIVGIRTFHGKDAHDILRANEGQANLFSMTIICRKTETVSAILSQRFDFDCCWESLHPYLLL